MRQVIALLSLIILPFVLLAQIPLDTVPTLALGQPAEIPAVELRSNGPNWVDGKGLDTPQAVAIDEDSGAIYVADFGNNRVLGWRDGISFANGARADLVIGQRDEFSNGVGGPGTSFTNGLNQPSALVVKDGDLYVVDGGNNRIVKFSRPFEQQTPFVLITQVIGQPNKSTGTSGIGRTRMDMFRGASRTLLLKADVEFDAAGNLWAADPDNHRVLRFPAAAVGEGAPDGPQADLVLGQPDFNTKGALPRSANNRQVKTNFNEPAGLGFDAAGRLYVSDSLNRVLVFVPPFVFRQGASRVMGITQAAPGTVVPVINATSLGIIVSGNQWRSPQDIFAIGNKIFVVDSGVHRITRYKPFDEWPDENIQISPPAEAVIGQDSIEQDLVSFNEIINRGRADSGPDTLFGPSSAVVSNGRVYVADAGNNRVLQFPDLSEGPPTTVGAPYAAQRILGQLMFEFRSRNFIEGKEFAFSGSTLAAGIAFDNTSDPPRMYVADPNNNRVLGFADARNVQPGDIADIVLGQPGRFRAVVNFPGGFDTTPNDTGLFVPAGVAVDGQGNLFVADRGNARVLRFPKPFEQEPDILGLRHADLVLGQFNFTTTVTDPSPNTMRAPYGLAFTQQGWLLVSDVVHNRVLLFQPPFENGEAAVTVFGQSDFTATTSGAAANQLANPRHISTDTDDRVYVCDTGNGRVQIFGRVVNAQPGASAVLSLLGQREPTGVFVSSLTGEIWVTDRTNTRRELQRYPKFDTLITQGVSPDLELNIPLGLLAVQKDGAGNLYAADSFSRVLVFFPGVSAITNAADGQRRVAPGMFGTLWLPNIPSITAASAGSLPLPTTLSDVQVLVNGQPAPIIFMSGTQINFLVSNDAPINTVLEIVVRRVSTKQILATGRVRTQVASPAFFTTNQQGFGQIAAVHLDGTCNGPDANLPCASGLGTRPAQTGEYVSLFGTGAGHIPGSPPDGSAASGPVNTPRKPRVFVQGTELPAADVQYSGLAPGLVGVWQLNIKLPETLLTGDAIIIVIHEGVPSGDPTRPGAIVTTVAVRRP